MIPSHRWLWRARPLWLAPIGDSLPAYHDGDTFDAIVDLAWRNYGRRRIRLLGVNAPELREIGGPEARSKLHAWLTEADVGGSAWPLLLESTKPDAFGRWLATVWRLDGRCLNDDLNEVPA